MENAILTSECMWCNERWIKTRIGVGHGCEAEKNAKNEAIAPPEQDEPIDLFRRQ